MKTITFYSYKGGTGRTLALANAARYLARLEFKVVVVDFDLEAPGLHYKFWTTADRAPLPVKAGVVDYIYEFVTTGLVPSSIKDFTLDVSVPGTDKPLIQLIAAGSGPSTEYWSKLSGINWHELFYSKGASGVQMFLDLKNRIADELKPDFLLIDSRTGITEMGGVATSLLADKVIAFVLPTLENLEGARAVLRSLRLSRCDSGLEPIELMIALSRVPEEKEPKHEYAWMEEIRNVLNQEAENLEDTLSCSEIFVLHSEPELGVQESLRVGSGISPDDSVLLRDYLRLFANVVPRDLIESKVGTLIELAKAKIWIDPDAALKEVEELAESFGHPEAYRELLRFYEVRNVAGTSAMKRAQRLWELTRDSGDNALWSVVGKGFNLEPRWRKRESSWAPNMDFVESVWREAGKRDARFGEKIAEYYYHDDRESQAADILLEILQGSVVTSELAARCIGFLDSSKRSPEATMLIHQLKAQLMPEVAFVEAWAKHAVRGGNKEILTELVESRERLDSIRPYLQAQVLMKAGFSEEATLIADRALNEIAERGFTPSSEREFLNTGELFAELGRFEEFEKVIQGRIPSSVIEELRARIRPRRK